MAEEFLLTFTAYETVGCAVPAAPLVRIDIPADAWPSKAESARRRLHRRQESARIREMRRADREAAPHG